MAKKLTREQMFKQLNEQGAQVPDDISLEDLVSMCIKRDIIPKPKPEEVKGKELITSTPGDEEKVKRQKVNIKERVVDRKRLYEIHKDNPQVLKDIESITLNGYDAVLWFRIQELVRNGNKHMTYGYSKNMITKPIKALLTMVLKHYGHYSTQLDASQTKFETNDFKISN